LRYALQLSYLGTNYHGWQKQVDKATVQSKINTALQIALQESVDVVGAGRTDAGVHAMGYVAHFDSETCIIDKNQFVYKLNNLLPADIAIQQLKTVTKDFHARFDAISRTYEYSIVQHKEPFRIDKSYFIKNRLDVKAMQNAANLLLNHKNFKSFSKVKTDVYTFDCEIKKAQWKQKQQHLVFEITANRFLRNMVRAIVGTLVEVGLHKISTQDFEDIILAQNRSMAGKSVPAHALILKKIDYPELIFDTTNDGE